MRRRPVARTRTRHRANDSLEHVVPSAAPDPDDRQLFVALQELLPAGTAVCHVFRTAAPLPGSPAVSHEVTDIQAGGGFDGQRAFRAFELPAVQGFGRRVVSGQRDIGGLRQSPGAREEWTLRKP